MKSGFILALLSLFVINQALAESIAFKGEVGSLPEGLGAGVTGKGSAKWLVEADPTSPSKSNVLKQSGQGTFPWCVLKDVALSDGFVEAKFKPISRRSF